MELKNFDNILSRVPKLADPLRVVLAGSARENMLQGVVQGREGGFVEAGVVGVGRVMAVFDRLFQKRLEALMGLE